MIALGGWSQFFASIGVLYQRAYRIEEAIKPRKAANCFVVAMIGKKPEGEKSRS
jgi:hypothetical protein